MANEWKKIKTYNKKYDVRLQISVKRIVEKLFRNPDYDKLMYREIIDYDKNRIIIELKHIKDDEKGFPEMESSANAGPEHEQEVDGA